MALQAIKYEEHQLQILDQLRLPFTQTHLQVKTPQDAWQWIKEMRVRGAPAIAIVAALSVAVKLHSMKTEGAIRTTTLPKEVCDLIFRDLDFLVTSRPTAVNLADAAAKLKAVARKAAEESANANGEAVADAYITAAERMLAADIQDNQNIGKHGSDWILENTKEGKSGEAVSIITHCNTGSLATAGYGTALGVVRALHSKSRLRRVYCTETRPYNQGSRLTAFELVHDGIPSTLITDSMAASLCTVKGASDKIAAIIVGADRVAANGDTANKIGTFALAIVAKHHGIKFLVAAPRTTIDVNTPCGKDIVIEERREDEVTNIKGPVVRDDGTVEADNVTSVRIAAEGVKVWNPAFDVTPARLIDGIVTEAGVIEKRDGEFDLSAIF